jgi:ATP-dependent Clp protease adaptor protein ClpS
MPKEAGGIPKEGAGTLTKPRAKGKLKPPSMWQVLLHNDDFTTQEFVVWVLRTVFHKPEGEAVRIMLNVHQQGKGLAGVYTHDVAETKLTQVKRLAEAQEFPLLCTMEPEA